MGFRPSSQHSNSPQHSHSPHSPHCKVHNLSTDHNLWGHNPCGLHAQKGHNRAVGPKPATISLSHFKHPTTPLHTTLQPSRCHTSSSPHSPFTQYYWNTDVTWHPCESLGNWLTRRVLPRLRAWLCRLILEERGSTIATHYASESSPVTSIVGQSLNFVYQWWTEHLIIKSWTDVSLSIHTLHCASTWCWFHLFLCIRFSHFANVPCLYFCHRSPLTSSSVRMCYTLRFQLHSQRPHHLSFIYLIHLKQLIPIRYILRC